MKATAIAALAAFFCSGMSPALADDDPMLAYNLGDLLGSEDACGLHFDQAAIERFIREKAPADDMGFMSDMANEAGAKRDEVKKLSQSEKTAWCAQARRVAKNYRFVD